MQARKGSVCDDMKQASRWFLCCTLAAALTLTGCGGGNSGSSSGSVSGSTSVGSSAAQSAAWRTGLGVLTETTGTDRAGNIHTVAAAVLLDADGKLAGVTLDELELSVSADSTGKVTTPTDTRTKRQKGKDYPLAEVSGLKKGWAEQADAFGSWLEGKTPDEVKKLNGCGRQAHGGRPSLRLHHRGGPLPGCCCPRLRECTGAGCCPGRYGQTGCRGGRNATGACGHRRQGRAGAG